MFYKFFAILLFGWSVSAEWEIINTGIPQTLEMDASRIWIVSDLTFNCLDKNMKFIWRIFHGETISQSQIVPGKGIVYLSADSKLGLRSLENGNLQWEISLHNVSKFTCQEYIYLNDKSVINFYGQKVTAEFQNILPKKRPLIKVDQDILTIGSLDFKYNITGTGLPKLYVVFLNELLVFTESGLLILYKDNKVLWSKDESLSKVQNSKFIKGDYGYIWVALTKFGKSFVSSL